MKAKIISLLGKDSSGEASLNKSVFGAEFRSDILHRVVNWQLAKRQAGTHKVKGRGEIIGGKKKPFKQKGTGNARQGSKNAPHMRGGGVSFGPVVRSHAHALPKKVRQFGLRVALSAKQSGGKLFVLNNDKFKGCKTAELVKGFDSLGLKSALIIAGENVDVDLQRAVANIKGVDLLLVQGANVYDIIRRENLILTEDAIKKLEERLDV